MTRVATVPLKAEITGLYEVGNDLFFNIQHPSKDLTNEYAKASVGVISNVDWKAAELGVATTDAEKATVRSSLGQFKILLQEGVDGAGVIKSIDGKELIVSNDPDFNGYVETGENQGLLFTNWENRPGGMSRAKIARAEDGTWSKSLVEMLDFSSVRGTWVNCFGTMSPWQTPLSSEELYFDNTADWNNAEYKYIEDNQMLAAYLEGTYPNPYDYGYILEITDPAGAATPVKHFALGRYSHENAVVMPDGKTAYMSDDGTNVVFYKFVADKENDLSAGTLYAAQIRQDSEFGADAATTAFDISWIELAHGSNDEIAPWIREYDGITMDDYVAGQTNYITDEEVAIWARGEAADNRVAFLESRKAAIAKGATGEFRKMEGVNINAKAVENGHPFMYMAMSEIAKGMSDGEGDISVAQNKCGVVYEMRLDANFNVSRMEPVVAGHGYDGAKDVNACPVDSISNPDNLIVLADGAVVIGEDTGKHENNAMWIWRR
ncbi:cell surface protein [Sulfitobacter donghicola DSW-25 = KCTC 12864 = JCM 14565]|uniref:Cell surface protein n=1 Tax=Sulfitobacter donghicola DSW-25 = KCTC 12864 = JCM 14565 TaxID=1300350 RepID=A0A073ITI2_9RHOB|nr:cell surface protein [Sulfitobacter donghicola DSW-25 = KCTC 12864 = JCM 14565]